MSNYLRPKYILSEYSSFGSKQYVASQIELDKKFEKHLETLDREKRKEISKNLKVYFCIAIMSNLFVSINHYY